MRGRCFPWVIIAVVLLGGCHSEEQGVVARVGHYVLTEEQLEGSADPVAYLNSWMESRLIALEAESRKLDRSPEFTAEMEGIGAKIMGAQLVDLESASLDSPSLKEIEDYYISNEDEFVRAQPAVEFHYFSGLDISVLKSAASDFRRGMNEKNHTAKYPGLRLIRNKITDPSSLPAPFNGFFGKPADTVTGPVEIDGRYYVFKILSRYEAGSVKPLGEVRDLIIDRILDEQRHNLRERLLKDLRKKYHPEVNVERLQASGIISGDVK